MGVGRWRFDGISKANIDLHTYTRVIQRRVETCTETIIHVLITNGFDRDIVDIEDNSVVVNRSLTDFPDRRLNVVK